MNTDITLSLRPPMFDLVDARKMALEAWKAHNRSSWFDDSQAHFVDRITVNYLRHCWTCYDELRRTDSFSSVEGTLELKLRVLDFIQKRYPDLTRECLRQRKAAFRTAAESSETSQHSPVPQPPQATVDRLFDMAGRLRREQEAHATLRSQHEELIEKFIELMVVAEQLAD